VKSRTIGVAELGSRLTALPAGTIQPVRTQDFGFLDELIHECVGAIDVRRLVVLPLAPVAGANAWTDSLVERLSGLLEASWPVWFGDHDLGWFRNDALGRERFRSLAGDLELRHPRISRSWLASAIRLASRGRPIGGASLDPTIQVAQTCLALSPAGTVLFLPFDFPYEPESAVGAVAAVEWIARHADAVVVPVIRDAWPDVHPVDRLLFTSWRISDPSVCSGVGFTVHGAPGISAVMGQPHPLSDVEKRVWAHLSQDAELSPLFRCNQTVVTRHGGRPRVDLLWSAGRVVVEFDGYADHGVREAFERDRHRDYELMISGYRVLRITNDEVERDFEAAIGKIRDVVHLRRNIDRVEELQ
jgi:very-short-patch-repair endonuclease